MNAQRLMGDQFMSQQNKEVTETEFAILNVLWESGPTTVRGIVEAIYRKHTHSLHASVKSLLERLADKGFVVCRREGGVHFFSATARRDAFVAQQLQLLADTNFGGSLAPLLSTLVDNVKLNPKDREAIRKIIDKID
jgi:BlaI family transcriptional regulator, penicillinase repressor